MSFYAVIFAATLFFIFFAFWPNRRVDCVCSSCVIDGVMQRMIAVRLFPPRLVFRILVRGEFRNGMCSLFPSAFIAITCVRKKRLLLMCYPSFMRRFALARC